MVVVEAGVDQGVDRLGDRVLHGAQRPPQLLVVRVVPSVQQAELRFVADHQAEVGGEAQLHLLARPVGPHDGAPDGREQVLRDGVDQLEVQGPLGREVLVEQRFGDPRRLGDVVHGGGPVAPLGEQLERHREQLVAPLFRREPPGGGLHRTWHAAHVTERSYGSRGGRGRRAGLRDSRCGRSARLKCSAATRWFRYQQPLVGGTQPCRQRNRVRRVEPVEPERRQLRRHGVGAHGQRSPVGRRLDGGVAEALPRRRQEDGVAGGVGVGDAAAALGLAEEDRAARLARRGAPAPARTRPRPGRAASRCRRRPPPARSPPRRSCAARARVGWSRSGISCVHAQGCPCPRPRRREAGPDRRCCTPWWRGCRGRPARRGSAR